MAGLSVAVIGINCVSRFFPNTLKSSSIRDGVSLQQASLNNFFANVKLNVGAFAKNVDSEYIFKLVEIFKLVSMLSLSLEPGNFVEVQCRMPIEYKSLLEKLSYYGNFPISEYPQPSCYEGTFMASSTNFTLEETKMFMAWCDSPDPFWAWYGSIHSQY